MGYRKLGLGIALAVSIFLLILIWNYASPKTIGGDKDEHGCLVGAGYSWDYAEKECVRSWISEGDERYQVNDFRSCAEMGYPIAESYPRQCYTEGGRHFVEEINEE